MPQYYWPANLTNNAKGWATSLVDWPDIVAVEATPQGSVISASESLSVQVGKRIENNATIQPPSELKPGQVQVPVDAATAAKLEAHIERQNERRLRSAFQIDQANRERRSIFLTEFRINLEPVERLRDHADDAAIRFALIALNSSYILNGGALVALPAILKFSEDGTINLGQLATSIWLFVAGIAFAALANLLAYLSVMEAGKGHGYEITARAIEVKISHYPPNDIQLQQANVALNHDRCEKTLNNSLRTAIFGLVFFATSIICFLIGVSIIVKNLSVPA